MSRLPLLVLLGCLAILAGCAGSPAGGYDYSQMRQEQPLSILVLPPVNHSLEVGASNSFLSQVTYPLAESGYYVLPVAVVRDLFLHNGLSEPDEIHALDLHKLAEIFAADAVLYITLTEFGTTYRLISSDTRVTAQARLVSLKTGQQLWHGSATASTAEQQSSSNGLVGMLISAAINQIADTLTERGHEIAGITSARLLSAGGSQGLLYGPRSERHVAQ